MQGIELCWWIAKEAKVNKVDTRRAWWSGSFEENRDWYARLKQAFGALLFEKVSRVEYMWVAVDGLIMVQIRDGVPLTDLIDNIKIIDVH